MNVPHVAVVLVRVAVAVAQITAIPTVLAPLIVTSALINLDFDFVTEATSKTHSFYSTTFST